MGKSQSSNLTIEKELEISYKYIRRYSNGCYGELTVIEKKHAKRQFALKQFVTENQNIAAKLSERKKKSHGNIVKLLEYWIKEQTSLCSNLKQVYLMLQYEENTLEDQILNRQSQQKVFTYNEIQTMALGIAAGLVYLQENAMVHTALSLKSILYTKEGQLKLLQTQLVSLYTNRNQYILQCNYNHCLGLQAPQILRLTYTQMNQSNISNINIQKAIVFSLGLLFLSICFLNDSIEQEVLNNGEYDMGQLKKYQRMAADKYSFFGDINGRMLSMQPSRRPSYREVYEWLDWKDQKQNFNSNLAKSIKQFKNIAESKLIPSKRIS